MAANPFLIFTRFRPFEVGLEFQCHLLNLRSTSLNLSQTQRRNHVPLELVSFPLSTPSSMLHTILSVLLLALPVLALLLLDHSPRPLHSKLHYTPLASALSDSVQASPVETGLHGTTLTALPSIRNSTTSTATRVSSLLDLLGHHQQLDSVTGRTFQFLFIDPLSLSLPYHFYLAYLLSFLPSFPPHFSPIPSSCSLPCSFFVVALSICRFLCLAWFFIL